ncbi:MAG: hypothetical protein ACJAQW_001737 [Paracoccaceae bacterium]
MRHSPCPNGFLPCKVGFVGRLVFASGGLLVEKPEHGVPPFKEVTPKLIVKALALGWQDMRRAPLFGLMFAAVYVLGGWSIAWIT